MPTKHKHHFEPSGNYMTVDIPPAKCLLHMGTTQICKHERKDVILNIKLDPEEYCMEEGCTIQLKHINSYSVLPDYIKDGQGHFINQ